MKYSAAAIAAAVAVAQAAPVDSGCKTVISVVYGAPVWDPTPAATSWAAWSSTTSKKPDASTKTETETWSAWDPSKAPVATTTTSASSWSVWETTTSKKTDPTSTTESWSAWETTTTSKKTDPTSTTSASWSEWETTSSATPAQTTTKAATTTPAAITTTTKAATTTPAAVTTTAAPTTTTAATTTSAPAPAATCGAEKSTFSGSPSGSCGCDFTTYCNQGANVDPATTKFWEQTSGALVGSLAECQALCNSNSKCEAVIWTDSSSAGAQDFKRCWQTSGLAAPSKDTYGQLSYKGTCKSTCSDSYGAQY